MLRRLADSITEAPQSWSTRRGRPGRHCSRKNSLGVLAVPSRHTDEPLRRSRRAAAGCIFARTRRLLPQLRDLVLLGSPKGGVARSQGLRWPPQRAGLGQGHPDASAAELLVEAIVASSSLTSVHIDSVAAFSSGADNEGCRGMDCPLTSLARRPGMLELCLMNSAGLGHSALLEIIQSIACSSPQLQRLALRPAMFSSSDFEQSAALGSAAACLLVQLRWLQCLELSWCGLGPEGWLALAEDIEQRLQKEHAVAAVADSPLPLTNLRAVDFSHNVGGLAMALSRLVSALVGCAPRLERVAAVGCDIDESSLAAAAIQAALFAAWAASERFSSGRVGRRQTPPLLLL